MHRRYAIAPALFARRDRQILPMLYASLGSLVCKPHHRPARLHRKDVDDTKLNRLLYREVHALARAQALDQRDCDGRLSLARLPRSNAQTNPLLGYRVDLRAGLAALAVEYDDWIAYVEPQYARGMMSRGVRKIAGGALRQIARAVETRGGRAVDHREPPAK